MLTLSAMNSDSELAVISAAGASRRAVSRPILALGLTVALLSNRQHVDGLGNYTNLRPVLSDVVQLWRSV